MIGIELVADRESKAPFPRARGLAERVMAAAKSEGLLLYSSTGCANGTDGDLVMLGPPFVITDDELAEAAEKVRLAMHESNFR
jgi:adenosylmethionine-8-amino-7-oxononanoate aminotransferase